MCLPGSYLRRSTTGIFAGQPASYFIIHAASWGVEMKFTAKLLLSASIAVLLAGCSVGVKRTAGMKAYSNADYATAIPLLKKEIEGGDVSARYSLGLAYRDGNGIAQGRVRQGGVISAVAVGHRQAALAVMCRG
ncbi:outer membrane protein assembly factor BamD [Sphingobium amiense]|uniref:hypothetical protein n=1 Tax=Sphingobium amiense TaxID=135719 RepID=UPI000F84C8C2|nr:hypothetical protein [Sphingobium amiense]